MAFVIYVCEVPVKLFLSAYDPSSCRKLFISFLGPWNSVVVTGFRPERSRLIYTASEANLNTDQAKFLLNNSSILSTTTGAPLPAQASLATKISL